MGVIKLLCPILVGISVREITMFKLTSFPQMEKDHTLSCGKMCFPKEFNKGGKELENSPAASDLLKLQK